jgi:hypothetical protein
LTTIELRELAFTVSDVVAMIDPSVAVTVWVPAAVALQLDAVQLPSGAIEKEVIAVISPRELPEAS